MAVDRKDFEKIKANKPDLETESFRMWKVKGEEETKKFEEEKENCVDITYKDMTLGLYGFNVAFKNKDSKEVVFAWKIKDGMLMTYDPLGEAKPLIEDLKKMAMIFGIEHKDMTEMLENIYLQKRSFDLWTTK